MILLNFKLIFFDDRVGEEFIAHLVNLFFNGFFILTFDFEFNEPSDACFLYGFETQDMECMKNCFTLRVQDALLQ